MCVTEAEARQRFESNGLEVYSLLPAIRPNGYIMCDPLRPEEKIGGNRCSTITYFWREEEEWFWE
jgi:hypothetical protein